MTAKTKILLVDDNAQMRNLLRITFSSYSEYELFQAQSGKEAVDLIDTHHPEILFLDVMMPGELDGLDVCRYVKSSPELQSTFVVLLSAKGQKQDIASGMEAGADKYLTKPFSPLALIEIASQVNRKAS
jgi:two-component system, OmpR family, phosphate regulon response regulator PhoB